MTCLPPGTQYTDALTLCPPVGGKITIELYERALVIAREIGDKESEGRHLNNLGVEYYNLGDARKVMEYYEQALAIAREAGDKREEGNRLANLGSTYELLGDMGKAREFWRASLEIYEAIEDRDATKVRKWLEEL